MDHEATDPNAAGSPASGNDGFRDALTGVYTRALLESRLTEELSRAARAGTGCAVFLFDVDYFKSINDAYGHLRGDEVLCQLTERINGLVRPYDVLFRYGGDEFVLVLPDTTKLDATRIALRLTQGVKATELPGEPPLSVSVSLGVAAFPDDATDPEGLLAAADRRNYLAKHRGRACAVADDVETDTAPASSRLLERDIAMGSAREFLTRVLVGERGVLAVTGERGAGQTRYLEEVARAGRLRGFTVVETDHPSTVDVVEPLDRPLLVLLDADLDAHVPAMLERLASVPTLGVLVGGRDSDSGWESLPVLDTVELSPWSSAAMRIWLRTTLHGEPDRALVDWLLGRTGGLPARVAREVQRLRERDGLVRGEHGAWSISPALLGRSARRRPLPRALTELIGRQQETAQVARLLAERRMVTLVGPAGIGKTRLSLAVAESVSFDDGIVYVPLANVRTEAELLPALAQALDLTEVPGQALADTIAEHLSDQSVLLVFDNFEQALDAAPAIGALLADAPGVKVLASSREKLGLYGEQAYRVPPLALPDLAALPDSVPAALAASPALALFHARARAAAYDFALTGDNLAAAAALCHRLDGLPLAIELAAAHSDELTAAQMLAQLSDRLDLPGSGPRGVPARQQTLRAAIDWSYALLDAPDRDLFMLLGAFVGGCRLDAVAAVSAGQMWADQEHLSKCLTRLVDKSLVRAEPDPIDGTRYVLLETVRAYAVEKLDEHPSAEDVRDMHAAHYSGLAGRAGVELSGPEQAAWVARVEREYQNLRTAFEYSLSSSDPVVAVEVVVGLWRYWRNRGQFQESREWLDRVLAQPLSDSRRARVLHAAAVLAAAHDDHEGALRFAREARERAHAAGDQRTGAQAGNALGIALMAAGEYEPARRAFAECLATWQQLGEPLGTAMAHGNLTMVALRMGEVGTASEHAHECLRLERAQGNTRGIMLALLCLGEIAVLRGDGRAARVHLDEALASSRQVGDVFGEAMALHQLGVAARVDGDLAQAARQVAAALGLRRDLGDREDLSLSLDTLAALIGDSAPTLAARLTGAAQRLREQHRLPLPADAAADLEATLARLGVALDPQTLEAERAAGMHATLDSVVDEALEYVATTF